MKYYFIIILVIFFKASSLIAVYESKDILNQVHSFLSTKGNLDYKINKKLKIPNCFGNIKIKKKYNSLKTLEIICLGEKPWKYNLRTNISVKNDENKHKNKLKKKKIPVLVSAVGLKRGHLIKDHDIKFKYLN